MTNIVIHRVKAKDLHYEFTDILELLSDAFDKTGCDMQIQTLRDVSITIPAYDIKFIFRSGPDERAVIGIPCTYYTTDWSTVSLYLKARGGKPFNDHMFFKYMRNLVNRITSTEGLE